MTDESKSGRDKAGHAANRPDVSDTSKPESGHTGAGQEATKGVAPGQHTEEHQSNYGGGGANGGSDEA
jgi:hypothetical protein